MLRKLGLVRFGLITLFLSLFASTAFAELTEAQAFPANAYEVTPSQAANLQTLLNKYVTVRLQPGDYTAAGTLYLDNCQRIYGMPGTQLGNVVIKPGTVGAVLSRVSTYGVNFPSSSLVTSKNLIEHISGPINVTGGTLENNLFLDLNDSALNFDNSQGGYMKNNRFIRVMIHGATPGISWKGDPNRNSINNVLLWTNLLTPGGDGIYLNNLSDLNIIGMDAESWNYNGQETHSAMMYAENMGRLRMWRVGGGQNINNSLLSSYFDIRGDELQVQGSSLTNLGNPMYNFTGQRAGIVNIENAYQPYTFNNQANFQFSAYVPGQNDASLNNTALSSGVSANQQNILQQMYVNPGRVGSPWERPVFGAVADPAGASWNQNLASQPDSVNYIQNLVNTQGIARLPAGIYYVSRPIVLTNGQGIIGAGEGNTAIIAMNPNIDLIVGGDHLNNPYSLTRFYLMDLTLQGGQNGIHNEPNGMGGGAQVNLAQISHVTIRDMQNAGIFIDRIMAWDNNNIDHLTLYNNAVGIKQYVDPNWTGGDTNGMTYLDKNVFYYSRFIGNGLALDFNGKRGSNMNTFVNCQFQDNRNGVAFMQNHFNTLFANNIFVNNGGNPMINSDNAVTVIGSYIRADSLSGAALSNFSTAEGCVFEMGSSSSARIFAGGQGFFYNNNSVNMPLGALSDGMLFNNTLAADASNLNQQVVQLKGGSPITVVPGTPSPQPQLLFGDLL